MLNQLAWNLRKQEPAKSLDYARQALEISLREKYPRGQAFAYKNLGTVYLNRGQYKTSRQYLQKALMLFKETGDAEQTGNIYNLFGLNYAERGEYQRALEMYNRGLEIFRQIKDLDGEAVVACNIGIVYYGTGNYNKAFELYHHALRIYQKLDNPMAVSNLYNNIGLIYSEQKRYEKAREYYHKSLAIDSGLDNIKGVIMAYNNIGSSYAHQDALDSSLHYHSMVLELAGKIQDRQAISHAQINIGELYLLKAQYKQADSCFNLAHAAKIEMDDKLGQTIVLLNKGKLYYLTNAFSQSVNAYENCLDLARQISSVKYLKEASYGLFEVYDKMGNENKAFTHFKQYQVYKDSLLSENTNNRIFNIEALYKTEQEEQEKELLRKERIIERNRKWSYAMGAGFVILLAGILVLWQVMRIRRERHLRQVEKERNELQQQNLRQELEHNRNELMAYTQTLLEKNRLLEELRENLQGIDLTVDQLKEKTRLEKISELTQARIITEEDWMQFKKLFDKVFPGFFNKLKENYPGITTAETRLAALIRLNLSGKEIATMTGVSAESVKKTRQRIRKKMELQQEDDLEQLIHSL